MIITIVAGPGEGKSGTAYWLAEQLKKQGATNVIVHDSDTTAETDALIKENYKQIVSFIAKKQDFHIVTKQKHREITDKSLVSSFEKTGIFQI